MNAQLKQDIRAGLSVRIEASLRFTNTAISAIMPHADWKHDIWSALRDAQQKLGDAMLAVSTSHWEVLGLLDEAARSLEEAQACVKHSLEEARPVCSSVELNLEWAQSELAAIITQWGRLYSKTIA